MIGVVVVSHGNIAPEMIDAVHKIFPEVKHLTGVAVDSNSPLDSIRGQVAAAIEKVDAGKGVLILTDMFGGTPSNVCLSFLENPKIEVLSGVNLPMLVKLAGLRADANFTDTVTFIQHYGQKNIVIASHVLTGARRGTGQAGKNVSECI